MQKYPHSIESFSCTQKMLAFIPNKFFNFFRNMFNTKTIKNAPSFIFLGKLFLEKTPLNLGSFLYFCISKFVKG